MLIKGCEGYYKSENCILFKEFVPFLKNLFFQKSLLNEWLRIINSFLVSVYHNCKLECEGDEDLLSINFDQSLNFHGPGKEHWLLI